MQLRLATLALCAVASPALTAQVYRSTDDAPVNGAMSPATDLFLAVPGLATDFVRAGGGQFVELPDGSARYTCRVFSQSNLFVAMLLELHLTGRTIPVDPGYPPANTPNLGLYPNQYAPQGFIDTATFVYYTGATGTLTGVRNLSGAKISLNATAPIQIGSGANNHNEKYGLFGEFQGTVLSNPNFNTITLTGNPTLSLEFVNEFSEDTTHPQVYDQSLTQLTDGRALSMPGVADDYVFVPAADFREANNGQASLTGTLARLANLEDSWDVALTFQNRVDPGEANHPPVGSPVLQLLSTAYVTGGGNLDPASWHYYTSVTGTLIGTGINAGGEIGLTQSVAAQVGGGANNTNTYMGLYGAFTPTVLTQPSNRTIGLTGDVELFGLTAVFPVLPFPSLTVPAQTPTHPTVTDQGIVLQGDNLAWVELAAVDFDLLGKGDEQDFVDGWFRIIDNQHIEVHAAPGGAAGLRNLLVYTPAIQSNTVAADFVLPTTPVLYAEPEAGAAGTLNFRMHHGVVIGPALALIGISQSLAPSAYPGITSLDIGNAFTDFVLDPTLYGHDADGMASFSYGPLNPALLGSTYYFQGMVVDVGRGMPPFDPSNHWRVTFQ